MSSPPMLPPQIQATVMSFMREVEGEYEINDMEGFVLFIVKNMNEYPDLKNLLKIDEDALVGRYERTGEVPPGVKLVRTTQEEGSNVVGLEVLHGPIPPKS